MPTEAVIGSKSPTTDTSSSTSPSDAGSNYLTRALNKSVQAAKTPYQPYTGELVAGVNDQEQRAIDATNKLQGKTEGYLGQAANYATGATSAVDPTELNGAAIGRFENPYQSDVINATLATINNQNQQDAQRLNSGLISSGSFGGDRAGVAQAALAGQQDLAKNATIAQLNSQNYAQALAAAQQQQATRLSSDQANRTALSQGAELYSGLGNLASSTGIANAGAQLQGGVLQQQTAQAADSAKYGQFMQQMAFPYQQAQFLAGITGSLAPQLGSSTSGTQVSSPPNPLNSILGGGLSLLGFLSPTKKARGGRVGLAAAANDDDDFDQLVDDNGKLTLGGLAKVIELDCERRARGGRTLGGLPGSEGGLGQIRRYADGGLAMPYGDANGYIPSVGLAAAWPLPIAQPNFPQPTDDSGTANLLAGEKAFANSNLGQSVSSNISGFLKSPFANGGLVADTGLARAARGYDSGGVVPDTDALLFDPNAAGGLGNAAMVPGVGNDGLGAAGMVPPPPLPSDAPKPVPVAPAPNVTPVLGYADSPDAPAGGLGAIEKAAPTSSTSMDAYYGRVRAIENRSGDNSATSPAGAVGAYQFMPSTWADVSKRHPDLGLTSDGIRDPKQQESAVRALTADNTAALKAALGRDPTPAELYLAHQQGAGGAISLLSNPNARAGDLVGDKGTPSHSWRVDS